MHHSGRGAFFVSTADEAQRFACLRHSRPSRHLPPKREGAVRGNPYGGAELRAFAAQRLCEPLGVSRAGAELELAVADQGTGILPENREKIFRLYFTTRKEGSGMGLAMTFRVVQLHNGTIDFVSEPGKGTTFRVRLPALEAA